MVPLSSCDLHPKGTFCAIMHGVSGVLLSQNVKCDSFLGSALTEIPSIREPSTMILLDEAFICNNV
jgi:hypothetical protein